ncbi:MAG: hypothetical protein RL172_1487 [Bacteroidota bacterium]|jgi:16S rRNA (uracil1498-N3)-methyltransferase
MNFKFVLHYYFMALPFFYTDVITSAGMLVLEEDTSKHIVQVLRMQNGEQLTLTNGKGDLFTAQITDNNRKRCAVTIVATHTQPPPAPKLSVAVSLLKNASRFEWFLEKATEIGINDIIPLICSRTEKQQFKYDRMNSILISAMLQSQQVWLPTLHQPIKFASFINNYTGQDKYIAHCEAEGNKLQLAKQVNASANNKLILIGPEGDFSKEEISLALQNNYTPVALGNTRLRTETAAMVAAALLRLV